MGGGGGDERLIDVPATTGGITDEQGLLEILGVKPSTATRVDGGKGDEEGEGVFRVLSSSWLAAHLNNRLLDARDVDNMQRNFRDFAATRGDEETER